jgi:hypothetical protein
VHHEGGHAGQDTDDQCPDNGWPAQRGIGRSLRPGTGVPRRVLVADMGDGSLFLQGWRDGPSAHLNPSRRGAAAAGAGGGLREY